MLLVLLLLTLLLVATHGVAPEHASVQVLLVLQLEVAVLYVLAELADLLLPPRQGPLHLLQLVQVLLPRGSLFEESRQFLKIALH